MSSYSLGVIVGLAVTFAILLISFFLRKKYHAGEEHYDERQIYRYHRAGLLHAALQTMQAQGADALPKDPGKP